MTYRSLRRLAVPACAASLMLTCAATASADTLTIKSGTDGVQSTRVATGETVAASVIPLHPDYVPEFDGARWVSFYTNGNAFGTPGSSSTARIWSYRRTR